MHDLNRRIRRLCQRDDGMTLIELVVTVAIVGVIVVSLTGVVMAYLKTTVTATKRMTESHDVQFAAAYWQKDVASIGLRSSTYCKSSSDPGCSGVDHSFKLLQSVNVTPTCALPTGSQVVTLAWSSYTSLDSAATPDTVTVTYVARSAGAGASLRYALVRVRCTNATVNSTVTVADNLISVPTITCSGASPGCNGSGSNVPTTIAMALSANDPDGGSASNYQATLSGERRET